jgi:hypothetical protein
MAVRHRIAFLANPLARDVAAVFVVKAAIVIAAALFVFGPAARPAVDAAAVKARLLLPAVATPAEKVTGHD